MRRGRWKRGSTEAGTALAVYDMIPIVAPQYVLQVSSPGERQLRTSADWRRFVGEWANVLSPEHGGRVEGKIMTVEGDAGSAGEAAVLELENGAVRRIPLAAIKEARLAFHL